MKYFMLKLYRRYYIPCIFMLIFMNGSIFLYFLRYQTQMYSIKDTRSIESLHARLEYLINLSVKELHKQQSMLQEYMRVLNDVTQTEPPSTYCRKNLTIPILIMTCNRPTGLQRTLRQLIRQRKELGLIQNFPIFVSQGCQDRSTYEMVLKFEASLAATLYYKQPDNVILKYVKNRRHLGYYKISDHYKVAIDWLLYNQEGLGSQTSTTEDDTLSNSTNNKINVTRLGRLPLNFQFDSLVIVEDDLDIAPDFLYYFLSTHDILKNDPTLFCVSAWNDNGKSNLVDENAFSSIYRTDFFPGLGWMLMRSFWLEVREKWPMSFWDEYLREPSIRKDRQCLRPELPRTATFGRKGVSNGQFFDKHLRFLMLNKHTYNFCSLRPNNRLHTHSQLPPIQFPPAIDLDRKLYRTKWLKIVYHYSEPMKAEQFMLLPPITPNNSSTIDTKIKNSFIRIEYSTKKELTQILTKFKLMDDLKSGIARTAFHNIVTFVSNGYRVFVAPQSVTASK